MSERNCTCGTTDYLPPCRPECPPAPPCPPVLPPICPPKPPCPPNDCSNHTPYYGLPQWKASDVTSWLMQMNGAMLRIDTILHDLALRTGINGLPDDLVTTVSKLCGDVEVLKCSMGELTNKQANIELLMQNINTQFSAMKTDVASMQLSLTNFDTRLMTVDSKANALKNDVTMLKSDVNMLSSTLQGLQKNFTEFQLSVNQTLAEHTTSIEQLETADFTLRTTPLKIESSAFSAEMFEVTGGTIENFTPAGMFFCFERYGNPTRAIWNIYLRDCNRNKITVDAGNTYLKMSLKKEYFNMLPHLDILSPFTIGTAFVENTAGVPILVKYIIRNGTNQGDPVSEVSIEYHVANEHQGKEITVTQTSARIIGSENLIIGGV